MDEADGGKLKDVWITWDVPDEYEEIRGTFLKVDDNETPGIPDDDVVVAMFPVARTGSGGGQGTGGGGAPRPVSECCSTAS